MSRGDTGRPVEDHILWVGGVFDEATLLSRRATSPAANRWQGGLIRGLAEHGARVTVLGHTPEPVWPRGVPLVGGGWGRLAPGLHGKLVRYWNLPAVRRVSVTRAYLRAFDRLVSRHGRPSVVISYNDQPWSAALGDFVQRHYGIPWVCVVADAPGAGKEFRQHEQRIARAAGRVFLSWSRYREDHSGPGLHLDGGIDAVRFTSRPVHERGRKVLVFAGAMNRWAGASLLVDAFSRTRLPDAELWLCGHGSNADVERAAAEDPRVRYLGLVEEERLQAVCREAAAFVNPRPVDLHENRSNFPSKVLEYLTYGRPVVSTWTEGLAPEYRDVLVTPDQADPDGLARAMERALAFSIEERGALAERIRKLLVPGRTWSAQAARLLEWMADSVLPVQRPRQDRVFGASAE